MLFEELVKTIEYIYEIGFEELVETIEYTYDIAWVWAKHRGESWEMSRMWVLNKYRLEQEKTHREPCDRAIALRVHIQI